MISGYALPASSQDYEGDGADRGHYRTKDLPHRERAGDESYLHIRLPEELDENAEKRIQYEEQRRQRPLRPFPPAQCPEDDEQHHSFEQQFIEL